MLFNSLVFVIFLAVVLVLYYAAPRGGAKYIILASSYFFYGWWDWRFLSLIVGSTFVDYFAARLIAGSASPKTRRTALTFSIVFNLGLLGVFKYFDFFAQSLGEMMSLFGMAPDFITLSIILPVGISFYTFQTMSYTIDVYHGSIEPERNFIAFASFVAFFPQLVAGPIERAGSLLPQLREKQRATAEQIRTGIWLMLWGYFLKVYMADNLGVVVDQIYASAGDLSGADVILAQYAFSFQILGDFAGYSYIAIGVAKLFGVDLNQNFRFPFFIKTPGEFWRNWHISLSSWLRDYLYIPLGGNRGSPFMLYRNLMLTMLLGGLWHGAAWNFVIWGFYQGALLVVFRLARGRGGNILTSPAGAFARIVLMFHLTCIGWLLFRTPDMQTLGLMLGDLTRNLFAVDLRTYHWASTSAFFISIPLAIMLLQFRKSDPHRIPFKGEFTEALAYVSLIMLLLSLGNWGTKSFIYFQF